MCLKNDCIINRMIQNDIIEFYLWDDDFIAIRVKKLLYLDNKLNGAVAKWSSIKKILHKEAVVSLGIFAI